ncbi:hypothetical protein [Burkholderia gladioli]|uniref:hypothetical protein n=2 Tax=Burkholderia gladioli TaxID=28095 RepID=UPI000F7FB830|nr:hypothetical protein [Burkholderia gladioli]MBU9324495.1 hypothetical protein [Burkholderia gladioli]MDD1790438.1 hypothetical protein [Burkholderia gladioli]MDN7811654.1 hypothetical protein [Burkholderia gladioli]URV27988.1 hypothetical protein NAL90_33295 [Burkholderia gladioli]
MQFIYERKHDEIALADPGFQSFECIGAAAEMRGVREAAGCEGRRAFAGHFRRISPALPPRARINGITYRMEWRNDASSRLRAAIR